MPHPLISRRYQGLAKEWLLTTSASGFFFVFEVKAGPQLYADVDLCPRMLRFKDSFTVRY